MELVKSMEKTLQIASSLFLVPELYRTLDLVAADARSDQVRRVCQRSSSALGDDVIHPQKKRISNLATVEATIEAAKVVSIERFEKLLRLELRQGISFLRRGR